MKIAIVSDTHDNTANFNKAIDFLNTQKITTLAVTDPENRPLGVIHLHDILRAGIM